MPPPMPAQRRNASPQDNPPYETWTGQPRTPLPDRQPWRTHPASLSTSRGSQPLRHTPDPLLAADVYPQRHGLLLRRTYGRPRGTCDRIYLRPLQTAESGSRCASGALRTRPSPILHAADNLPELCAMAAHRLLCGCGDRRCRTLVGFSLVFSSNQTGNLLILGISLAGLAVPSLPALAPPIPHAVSIASFIAGSLLAGLALPPAPGPRTRGAFVVSDLAQAALLLCCAVAAIFGAPGNAVLAIASLCMGAQAAHARRSGVAELSATTVVTSVLSDLASDPGLLRGRNAARD
ncbi:hypothetical protein DFJ74DRAFT_698285, partial [Hyaloraphidium curvatum]